MKLLLKCQTPENIHIIVDVLADSPTEDEVILEREYGVYFLECAKSHGSRVKEIFVAIPIAWVEDPAMGAKLGTTAENFAACAQEWL